MALPLLRGACGDIESEALKVAVREFESALCTRLGAVADVRNDGASARLLALILRRRLLLSSSYPLPRLGRPRPLGRPRLLVLVVLVPLLLLVLGRRLLAHV